VVDVQQAGFEDHAVEENSRFPCVDDRRRRPTILEQFDTRSKRKKNEVSSSGHHGRDCRHGAWTACGTRCTPKPRTCCPATRKPDWCGAVEGAGGGTRTPDTRIMMALRLGSTEPKTGPGGRKRGHIRTTPEVNSVCPYSPAPPARGGAATS
jgi:hypothetical protein